MIVITITKTQQYQINQSMANIRSNNPNPNNSSLNRTGQTYKTINTRLALNVADPDEQFILDIIRVAKQESIIELVDNLRLQESKSTMLIRMLERYRYQLDNKNLMKNEDIKQETIKKTLHEVQPEREKENFN